MGTLPPRAPVRNRETIRDAEVVAPEWDDRHFDIFHRREIAPGVLGPTIEFASADAQARFEMKVARMTERFGPHLAQMVMEGTEGWGHEIVGLLGMLMGDGATWDELKAWIADPDMPGLNLRFGIGDVDAVLRSAMAFHQESKLCEYQSTYTFIKDYGGKARIVWHDEQGRFRHRSVGSFIESEVGHKVQVGETKEGVPVTMPAAKHWVESPHRRTAERVVFRPGRLVGPDEFNIWRGWPVKMREGRCDLFCEHMWENMCNGDEEVFMWLMGWMADAVQNAHRTGGTAVVLRGPQGSGKNFWAEHFMELFGPHKLMITNSEQVTGKFNSHLEYCSVLFANEAFFAGSNKEKNALKSLVTDGTIMVEPKGVDAFPTDKKFRLIIASNEDWVVNIEDSDRRFLVLEVDAGEHNNDGEYFEAIQKEWESGGREALMSILWHWNEPWDERSIPETEAKADQRELSMSKQKRWVHDALEAGEVASLGWYADGATLVAPDDLPDKTKKMAAAMREMGAQAAKKTIAGTQRRGWLLPPLGQARRAWAEATGHRPEWRDAPDEEWGHVPGCTRTEPRELGPQGEIPF